MNDRAAFEAAVKQAPKDKAVRLVYADWLQDRGDERSARLLRKVPTTWVVEWAAFFGRGHRIPGLVTYVRNRLENRRKQYAERAKRRRRERQRLGEYGYGYWPSPT